MHNWYKVLGLLYVFIRYLANIQGFHSNLYMNIPPSHGRYRAAAALWELDFNELEIIRQELEDLVFRGELEITRLDFAACIVAVTG